MDVCQTLKVKSDNPEHDGGFVVINAADFNPDEHERFADDGAEDEGGDTIKSLREKLTAAGVQIPRNTNKAGLQALLQAWEMTQ